MSTRKRTIKGGFYKAVSPPCRQEKDKLGVREESKYEDMRDEEEEEEEEEKEERGLEVKWEKVK